MSLDTSKFTQGRVLEIIKNDSTVLSTIKEVAAESAEIPWDVISIHELVYDALDIDLDLDDTGIFKDLLIYFNTQQAAEANIPA